MVRPAATVPDGLRLYVVSDIHGRSDLLDDAFARIDADRARAPAPESVEVFLGDYIDRGPDSKGVLDRLVARRRERRLVTLAGNHEQVLLNVLKRPDQLDFWARNGGFETLMSYGITVPTRIDVNAAEPLVAALAQALPDPHRDFLQSLEDSFSCGGYFFAHAGVRPGVPLDQQSRQDLLWIRNEFLESHQDFGAVVVHGHTPVQQVEFRPNRINIDTGAYITNMLSCLVLEGHSADLI